MTLLLQGAEATSALAKSSKASGSGGIGRLLWPEEQITVFEECKLLVWANSLLTSAYDFIADFVHKHPYPPPFEIPKFRFVAAGMAIAQRPFENNGKKPTTTWVTYLLEEVLPGVEKDFVKYLHNASATSELSPEDNDYHLAKFLTFIQHLQYVITGGVAYVSDFQGMLIILKSSSVIMILMLDFCHRDLFGDGNIGKVFNQFPREHQCTEHCAWFELEDASETQKKLKENMKGRKKQGSSNAKKKSQPAGDI
ncbi:hypothetical protein CPB84DRAFT_1684277 [Gymnopilus junonius]|uniref:Alpha-type protein kinase domain-containing protein n=1 Tax=Gymnopilus junonius TaxID=109634 RepID=A0A9P5TJH2_GYMJU|nr:hypothetical protein CPB84DRAFT_1684277 [Gymnopilus junonius]